MKHWPSQLFPIIVLTLLAGMTFWLQRAVDSGEVRSNGKLRHEADATAENFTVRRFDQNGQVKYRLTAPYLIHYPDDDSSEVNSPLITSYRPGSPPVTITSKFARVTSQGEIAYFWEDVVITRTGTPERPALIARTNDLTAKTEVGFAFTNSPVEITQGQSRVTGIGAEIDSNAATFVLQSQVKGQYIRPRAQP